ncbi:hypothetical protein AS29_005535 [Bacillus sp. SJS]|nr:hypothetical protein AS29_005535 [Bacillus sp. SJS]
MPGFGAHRRPGAATKSGRGSCQKRRSRRGLNRERVIRRDTQKRDPGVRQRGRREAVVCQKIVPCTHTVRVKEGRKNHRAEEGSALVGQRDFKAFRGGRRERLYERKREEAGGTTDRRGTRSKRLAALDLTAFLRDNGAGSPERLYEREREKAGETTDGRGTRPDGARCTSKRGPALWSYGQSCSAGQKKDRHPGAGGRSASRTASYAVSHIAWRTHEIRIRYTRTSHAPSFSHLMLHAI